MSRAAELVARIATYDDGAPAGRSALDALERPLAAPARASPALADAIAEAPAPVARGHLRAWRWATHGGIAIAGVAVAHGMRVMAGAPGARGDGLWWLPLLVTVAALGLLRQGLRQARGEAAQVDLRHAARLAARLTRQGAAPEAAARAAAFVYDLPDESATELMTPTEGHVGVSWARLAVVPPPEGALPGAAGVAAGLVLVLGLLFWGQYFALLEGGLQGVLR